MKKVMAVTAGFLVAFAPASTAFAGETGAGNAWGNCKNSAAGGVKAQLAGLSVQRKGQGLGGLTELAKASAAAGLTSCVVERSGSTTGGETPTPDPVPEVETAEDNS